LRLADPGTTIELGLALKVGQTGHPTPPGHVIVTVIGKVPEMVGSCTEVAVIVAVPVVAGAVKSPVVSIVPADVDHVTDWLAVAGTTAAVHCDVPPVPTLTGLQVTTTPVTVGGGGGTAAATVRVTVMGPGIGLTLANWLPLGVETQLVLGLQNVIVAVYVPGVAGGVAVSPITWFAPCASVPDNGVALSHPVPFALYPPIVAFHVAEDPGAPVLERVMESVGVAEVKVLAALSTVSIDSGFQRIIIVAALTAGAGPSNALPGLAAANDHARASVKKRSLAMANNDSSGVLNFWATEGLIICVERSENIPAAVLAAEGFNWYPPPASPV
jgi:hypothetical protein